MASTLISGDENWQNHLKNWPDRILHIKENGKFTDFQFIIGTDKKVFHIHKMIFAILSFEFEKLFYLQTDLKEIEHPENTPEVFEEFLNFIYKGKLNLTCENIEEVMKLAKLYSIKILAGKCENFLLENVVKENVLKFLDLSNTYNLILVTSKCLKIISENSTEICESPLFSGISKQSLDRIVESDLLSCDQVILFKAVEKWSEFECERNQKEPTTENKIAAVGEIIVDSFLITFKDYFEQRLLSSKKTGQLTMQRCCRFPNRPEPNKGTLSSIFNISVNKNVILCGYGVFGRKLEALEEYGKSATFNISLRNETKSYILSDISEVINCDGTDKIYEIFLKNPVLLEKSIIYNILECEPVVNRMILNYYGDNGKTTIEENGVTFKITKDPSASPVISQITAGTIASFIFCLK